MHPDDADKPEFYRQAIERGEDHSFEYRMIAKDGKTVWFYDSVMVENLDGKPVKTRSVMVDITGRKQAEAALRESENRLNLAVRGTSDGLWDSNLETGKNYWSPRFKQLLGYGEDEIEATWDQFLALLHPEDKADVLEAIRLHLEENRPYDCEFRMQTKGGENRWFQSRGEALRDENGRPYRIAGSIRDITDRKQTEEEVRQLQENLTHVARLNTMGKMATGLAHELNQPLAGIANYCYAGQQLLAKTGSANPEQLESHLVTSARRARMFYTAIGSPW